MFYGIHLTFSSDLDINYFIYYVMKRENCWLMINIEWIV